MSNQNQWPPGAPWPPGSPTQPGPSGASGPSGPAQNDLGATVVAPSWSLPGQGQPPPAAPQQPGGYGTPSQVPWGSAPPAQPQWAQPSAPSQPQWGQAPNPYGAPSPGPYGAPAQNPYGAPSPNPYGAPSPNPYGAPSPGPYGAPAQNPYGNAAPAWTPPTPPSTGGGMRVAGIGGAVFAGIMVVAAKVALRSAVTRGTRSIPNIGVTQRAPAELPPDEAMNRKLDPYITSCINRFSSSVLRSRRRYLQWADATTGPTGRERNVYGIFEVSGNLADCGNAITQAAGRPPSNPGVETAATQYYAALQAVVPAINSAHAYYERGNYRDDQMARGRAMHAQLMQSFTSFDTANQRFTGLVEQLQDQATTQLLARIQTQPNRQFEYRLRSHQRTAKQIVNLVDKVEITPQGMVTGVDATALLALVATLEQSVDGMTAYAQTHATEANDVHGYSSYSSEANQYLRAVKAFARHVRDAQPYSSSDLDGTFAEHHEGTPQNVIYEYNDLVRSYNFLF